MLIKIDFFTETPNQIFFFFYIFMNHLILPSRHYEFNFYICVALDVAEVLLVDHDVSDSQASPSQLLSGQAVLESKFLFANCNHFPLGISNAARYLKEKKSYIF